MRSTHKTIAFAFLLAITGLPAGAEAAGAKKKAVQDKADKTDKGELASVVDNLRDELARHVAAHPEIHLTSALERRGIAELRETLANFAFPIEQSR